MCLVFPIEVTYRNFITDIWFSSIELVSIIKEIHLTFVSTSKNDKPSRPQTVFKGGNLLQVFILYLTFILFYKFISSIYKN